MLQQLKVQMFIRTVALFLLTVLWSYAVGIKLMDLPRYQNQMMQQPFAPAFKTVLLYALLVLEATAAILLIAGRKLMGLWISLLLLIGFTIYIILILAHFYPKIPCSCGGFISKMSWKNHLVFNLILIALNIYCLYFLTATERRIKGTA